jgi:hypothetical protein
VPGPGGLIFTASKKRAMDLGLPTPSMIFRRFKKQLIKNLGRIKREYCTSQLVNY